MVEVTVQLVGGSSLAIVIPKAIADLKGIKKGAKLVISENESGDLTLKPK